LVSHFRRAVILPAIYGFTAVVLAACAWVFKEYPDNLAFGRVFYVFISVINFLSISIFWSFVLEVFDSTQAKRLFAIIAVGGSLGAFLGPVFTRAVVKYIGHPGILLVGAAMFTAAVVLQRILITSPHTAQAGATPAIAESRERGIGGNPFAGFMLVMRSPYMFGIMLFVVGISCVTTFL